jgi:hypothetical protein
MKKILLFISLSTVSFGFSQSSIMVSNTSPSATLAPNDIVYPTTTANNTDTRIFDVTNTSASTHTYNLYRYDIQLNTGATANFCFAGTCFPPPTMISGNLVLNAGQSASQSTTAYTMLSAELNEGASVGNSIVKYTFRNINTPSDSVQFTMKYNYAAPTGIKEYSTPFKSFDIYPNPAYDNVNITLNHKGIDAGEISLINALGQTVYSKQINFVDGKNKVAIDIDALPNGIYFAKVKSGEFISTKKINVQ